MVKAAVFIWARQGREEYLRPMNTIPVLLLLSFAPAAYLCVAMYFKDKYEPEPKRLLFAAFLAGCLLMIPAGMIELFLMYVSGGRRPGLGHALFNAFAVAAMVEESLKFCVLRFHAYPKKDFNEPLDGIVYGSFIALGFATVENVAYVLANGFGTGIVRMFISVPGHYAWGVILGYYVGKAKFEPHNHLLHSLRGLVYAVLLHGAFDAFLFQKVTPVLWLLTLVTLVISLRIARREIKELQADSFWRFGGKTAALAPLPVQKDPGASG